MPEFLEYRQNNTNNVFRTALTTDFRHNQKNLFKLGAWVASLKGAGFSAQSQDHSFPGLTLSEFKHELRMEDVKGDPWGVSLCAFFDLCVVAHGRIDVPEEWGYSVGWGGNHLDPESWFQQLFSECTDEQLLTIGNYLHRLTSLLEAAGKSY